MREWSNKFGHLCRDAAVRKNVLNQYYYLVNRCCVDFHHCAGGPLDYGQNRDDDEE